MIRANKIDILVPVHDTHTHNLGVMFLGMEFQCKFCVDRQLLRYS